MDILNISEQGTSISKKNEEKNSWPSENQEVGGGLFKGTIPNVKTDPVATREMKQRMEIS